jgi:hypothetical protein
MLDTVPPISPPSELETKEVATATVATAPGSRLQKLIPNRQQCFTLAHMGLMLFCGVVLPRYGTTLLIDLAWGAMELGLLTFVYERVGLVILAASR